MKNFTYYLCLLFILALRIRAIQLHSMSFAPNNYNEIGDKISNKVGEMWENQFNSFINILSKKIVDKLENHVSNERISDKMMVLLQNDADLFDMHHYKNHNVSLIQTIFFRRLKERFNNSKFGKKIRQLGSKAKNKIIELYHRHKDKVKHFFKILMKSLILPIAIQFIRRNIQKWKQNTLEATEKLDPDTKKIANPIIDKLYTNFGDKIDQYALNNTVNFDDEMKALDKLEKDKQEIDALEKQEKALLSQ